MTLAVGRAAAGRPAAWRRLRDLGGRVVGVAEGQAELAEPGAQAVRLSQAKVRQPRATRLDVDLLGAHVAVGNLIRGCVY